MYSNVRSYKNNINRKSSDDVIGSCFRFNKIMISLEKIDVAYLFSILFCSYGFVSFFYKAYLCINDVKKLKKEVLELQEKINKNN